MTVDFKGNGRANSFDGCPTQIVTVWRLHLVTPAVCVTAQIKASPKNISFISSSWTNQGETDKHLHNHV